MGIVSDLTSKVDIPHEPGEWVEIKKLSWRQMELAAEIKTEDITKKMKRMGGEILAQLQKIKSDQTADKALAYDRGFILEAGVVKWSYAEPVSKATLDMLDEQTAAWLFNTILAANAPKSDVDIKNG